MRFRRGTLFRLPPLIMDIKALLNNLLEEVSCSCVHDHIHRSKTAAMFAQFFAFTAWKEFYERVAAMIS